MDKLGVGRFFEVYVDADKSDSKPGFKPNADISISNLLQTLLIR